MRIGPWLAAVAVGALARNRSDEPGVERQERRGRFRERCDMRTSLLRAVDATIRSAPYSNSS